MPLDADVRVQGILNIVSEEYFSTRTRSVTDAPVIDTTPARRHNRRHADFHVHRSTLIFPN
jgi:hypothetical protein